MLGAFSVVLVAAAPGGLRDALGAMLASMPNVIMLEADDSPSAGASLQQFHPDLVIIDGDLCGHFGLELVRSIRSVRPATCCLMLANTISQQAAALRAGANRSPLKGDPAVHVFAQVEQLLSPTRPGPAVS